MTQKTIEPAELRRAFITEFATKFFRSGELLTWLNDHHFDEAASTVRSLDKNDPDAEAKIRALFGVDDAPRGTFFEAKATVSNLTGMHARTAGIFAQRAQSFESKIAVKANGKSGDAKNVLGLLSMGIIYGTELTLSAEGSDAEHAVKELKALVESGFGEEYYD